MACPPRIQRRAPAGNARCNGTRRAPSSSQSNPTRATSAATDRTHLPAIGPLSGDGSSKRQRSLAQKRASVRRFDWASVGWNCFHRLHRLPGARLNCRRRARNQSGPIDLLRFLWSGVENRRGHVTASGKSPPESKTLCRSERFQARAPVPLRELASPCAPSPCECVRAESTKMIPSAELGHCRGVVGFSSGRCLDD